MSTPRNEAATRSDKLRRANDSVPSTIRDDPVPGFQAVKEQLMELQRNRPALAGWYWLKKDTAAAARPVEVRCIEDGFGHATIEVRAPESDGIWVDVKRFAGSWAGPLPRPQLSHDPPMHRQFQSAQDPGEMTMPASTALAEAAPIMLQALIEIQGCLGSGIDDRDLESIEQIASDAIRRAT
jgi:hypothetical protein